MSKQRKSCMISAEAHSAMVDHLEELREKAQKNANFKINGPIIELWISEAILEKIERSMRNRIN